MQINLFGVPIKLCLCHHLPERSIKFFGIENYLCSRCFGILIGIILAILTFLVNFKINLFIAIILFLPCLVDGLTQTFNNRESTNLIRFITGLLGGFSLNYLLVISNYLVLLW